MCSVRLADLGLVDDAARSYESPVWGSCAAGVVVQTNGWSGPNGPTPHVGNSRLSLDAQLAGIVTLVAQ